MTAFDVEARSANCETLTRSAILLAAAVLSFAAGCLAARPHSRIVESLATSVGASRDVEMFAAAVRRLRSGESYYDAMGRELRQRKYPTASVFNWRPPLVYTSIALVSWTTVRAVLVTLAVLLLFASVAVLAKEPPAILIPGILIELGAVVTVLVPEAPFLTEVWAGVLVALSLCAYSLQYREAGAVIGLLAVFVRELVVLYAVTCALLALASRRKREFAIWCAGGAAYAAYFLWHMSQVSRHLGVGEQAHMHSWFNFGGLTFISSTLSMNALVLVAPIFASALLLAFVVAGILGHATPIHLRAAAALYLLAFMAIGQPFNYYWGFLTAPMLGLAATFGLGEIGRAVRTLGGSRRRRANA
jgi:hypothetical protein